MTKFLDDGELGPAIRDLVKGEDLRCAVAFWGDGAVKSLFRNALVPVDARLICDISMGGTNPRELEALGAPGNAGLAHLQGLHAKVYLSDRGLIVASANASNNGIGFLDVAGLVEAGTFHEVDSDAYDRASGWFDATWNRSTVIGADELELARDAWRRRKAGARSKPSRAADPRSLLERVLTDPGSFRGVGFVFTSGTSTAAHRKEGADAMVEEDDARESPLLSKQARKALRDWPLGNLFSDWSAEDMSAWPFRFVCAHQGSRGGISYWFYERSHPVMVDDDRGNVFATQVGGLRRELGFQHGRKTMAATDAGRLRGIFKRVDQEGHHLFENGDRLAEFVDGLDLLN